MLRCAPHKPLRDIREPDALASRMARLSPVKWGVFRPIGVAPRELCIKSPSPCKKVSIFFARGYCIL